MTKRERILSAPDLKEEVIAVPEWLGEESPGILVIGLTGAQRAKWLQASVDSTGKMDLSAIYPDLLIACCHDTEDRTPLFEPTDRDALNGKSGAILERIAQVAIRLSGLDRASTETASKN